MNGKKEVELHLRVTPVYARIMKLLWESGVSVEVIAEAFGAREDAVTAVLPDRAGVSACWNCGTEAIELLATVTHWRCTQCKRPRPEIKV